MRTILALIAAAAAIGQPSRVGVRFDTAEADAVLRIVALHQASSPIDWTTLTSTTGYQRLNAWELSMKRPFDDGEFRTFVESDELSGRAEALRRTVDEWAAADVAAAARRALAYLPADAAIHATAFAVIKPQKNSFVFEASTNPAIFLNVDPDKTRAQVENTLAHEMHHIGTASLSTRYEASLAALPPESQAVGRWLTAFGEGVAMLAAAGGPKVHPHASSPAADRERWDRDVANFAADLRKVEQFFADVLDRRLAGDAVQTRGMTYFGVQGPWYTVGWKMAVVVEESFGRAAVIESVADPRRLLVNYNRAVRERHLDLPLWSARVITAAGTGGG